MSKSISISFGKSKTSISTKLSNGFPTPNPVSLSNPSSRSALRHDSDDEEEQAPRHEAITGFAVDGTLLGHSVQQKEEVVIKNAGNGDWRRRGKNLLPVEAQSQRDVETKWKGAIVELDEVSQASGLKFADTKTTESSNQNGHVAEIESEMPPEPAKEMTEDEVALQSLLNDVSSERKSAAIIVQPENARPQGVDEADDFRADVASRPESATLEEYAAMPVKEFGMAMLRGMGQKRRANGEIIKYGNDETNRKASKIREPRQGYLGIGAKAIPGAEIELGAWGKADMRKNKKGEGLYTPVMLRDKRTGETITEEQLEARKKEAKEKGKSGDEDWRERRDRNLERSGRDGSQKYLPDKDDYRDQMNSFSRASSSGQERDGYDSSRSRRNRSQSRDRRHNDDGRHRERRRDKHGDEERYISSSSRRSTHRDRDKDRNRDDERRRRDY